MAESLSDMRARLSLRALVEHVFQHRDGLIDPLFYNELADRIGWRNKHGVGHGHGMGFVLGKMGHLLLGLEGEWGEEIPHLQSLVVNMTGPQRGLPDDGIKEFWPGYPVLSVEEKRERMRLEHQRILNFGSRWNDVLRDLDIDPIEMTTEKKGRPFGTSPESERHKLLKQFVAENPHLVGAADDWEVQLELALPTLDEIDVFFRSADVCIAVEVKSAVSDSFPWDYRRGLYQVVKYRALLESMRHEKSLGIPPQIDVLLVLESSLPKKFCSLAQKLCVRIVPNVKVSADLTSSG